VQGRLSLWTEEWGGSGVIPKDDVYDNTISSTFFFYPLP
jgi:hypothetical protein